MTWIGIVIFTYWGWGSGDDAKKETDLFEKTVYECFSIFCYLIALYLIVVQFLKL